MKTGGGLRRIVGIASGIALLLVAVGVLLAGYAWTTFAWSGGEYSIPPPSIGRKVGQTLPWALATLVAVAILALTGSFLIRSSRRPGHGSGARA